MVENRALPKTSYKTSFRFKNAIQKSGVSAFKPQLRPGEMFNRPSGNK